jgi:predicted enzyme related to lactoylglutathione lyase
MRFLPDKVTHSEIPADNTERALKFYKDTFGWSINVMPNMGYALLCTTPVNSEGTPTDPSSINGGMLRRQDPVGHPVFTIHVTNVEETEKQIHENGGKVVRGKMPVGDMGFAAYFQDTEGNVLGLWEEAKLA